MDLLSGADRLQIKSALKDVLDTFSKTIVTIQVFVDSIDRWNQNRNEGVNSTPSQTINTYGIVEYGEDRDSDKYQVTDGGADDRNTIKVTLDFQQLQQDGHVTITGEKYSFPFTGDKDKMIVNNIEYRISKIATDGFFDNLPVLVIIHGEPRPVRA